MLYFQKVKHDMIYHQQLWYMCIRHITKQRESDKAGLMLKLNILVYLCTMFRISEDYS